MLKPKIHVQDFLARMPLFNELAPAELDRLVGPGDSLGEALMFLGKPYFVSA